MTSTVKRELSKTAKMVAAYRGRASTSYPHLCNDPWATRFAGEDGLAISRAYDKALPNTERWIALRTAWLDDALVELLGGPRQIEQVVILGAGLDARAARLPRQGVRFFEVDAPPGSAAKQELASQIDGYPADNATYVACDFEEHDFLQRLQVEGFALDKPTVFVWEGVVYYLPEAAVRATLRAIATRCHEQSVVLFDFLGKRLVDNQANIDDRSRDAVERLDGLGEPLRFGTNHVVPLLYDEGFRWADVADFDEVCLRYLGEYNRAWLFRFQWLARASVTPPPRPAQ